MARGPLPSLASRDQIQVVERKARRLGVRWCGVEVSDELGVDSVTKIGGLRESSSVSLHATFTLKC